MRAPLSLWRHRELQTHANLIILSHADTLFLSAALTKFQKYAIGIYIKTVQTKSDENLLRLLSRKFPCLLQLWCLRLFRSQGYFHIYKRVAYIKQARLTKKNS